MSVYESGINPSFDYDFRTGNKDLINGTAEAKYYQYSSGTSNEITKTHTIDGVSIVGDTPTAAVSGSSSGRDNAGGQYIDLTGDLDTSYDQITIEVYVNIDSTTGKQVDNAGIFHFGVGDRDEMFNLYTNYGTKDTMGFGVQYNIATTTNISAHASGTTTTQSLVDGNNYMHFVYTCNGPTVNFYINGSLFSTKTNNSYSFGSATRSFNALGRSSRFDEIGGFIFATYKYCRIYNTALSSTQATTLYNNRDSIKHFQLISDWTTLRTNYGDVYLAQTLNKTLADYKAENIPLHDISFGAFHANKYKQSYIKDLLDVSGSFIQRQHIFYSDMSFNVSDLSAEQVIVNNDLSINSGFNIFQDSSFNSHVGIVGDASINGTLTIEDNSIPESALNFAKPASNFGTFDSTQDVSMSNTFTLQGDHERFIDLSQNIQTDFSENIVLVPGSLGIDLSGGIATLSGKTGDQAFLNGTYIVKDNSGNTTGNIYDDFNENTTSTPTLLSETPNYYWDFRVATPSGNTLADRVSGINATYYGGITSNDASGIFFSERPTIGMTGPQNEYAMLGNVNSGVSFSYEIYYRPEYSAVAGYGYACRFGDSTSTSGSGTHFVHNFVERSSGAFQINSSSYKGGNDTTGLLVRFYDAGSTITSDDGLDNNQGWTFTAGTKDEHVVFTLDSETKNWKVYRDGSKAIDVTSSGIKDAWNVVCDTNYVGTSGTPSSTYSRGFYGGIYYIRYYTDKILTDTDVATLYANASTINWNFYESSNNNKLTSLPKNWNKFQLQNGGGWLYDGSSNYTSYLDQYGRPQTVKGDSYDLTLPFHFYPSKAYLRTNPVLPTGLTNLDNYPASVKFLGASTQVSNYEIDTTPTFNWDFRTNVDASGVVIDSISQNKATINDTFCTEGDGLICNNLGHKATFEPFLTSDVANTVEMFCYHERNDSSLSAYWFNIVDTEDSKSTGYIAHRIRNNGNNDFYVNGSSVGSTYTYPNSPNFDAVNHIVMTTTSTTAKCYVNGSLVGSTTHSRTLVAGTYGYNSIGNRGSDTSQLYGNIYYVRFWNGTEITANQVSALYNNRYNTYLYKNTGPSKYYLLGEFENKSTKVQADTSANYTYNSTVFLSDLPTPRYAWDFRVATSASVNDKVNNIPATYVGATSTVEDGLAFTGATAHATIPRGILIGSGPSELSLEIYFKFTQISTWGTIFDMQINSAGRFRMTQDGDRGYFAILYGNGVPSNGVGSNVDGGGTTSILNLSTTANTWIHFTATIEYPSDYTTNGTIIRFYHNGTLINTVTGARYNTGTTPSTTTDHIGEGQDSGDATGNIRYLRWYDKRLSEEEITSLYNTRDNRDAFKNVSTTLTPFNGYIPTPTYNWDIRNNQSFTDNIGNNVGTGYHGATIGPNGLVCPGGTAGDHVKVTTYAWGGTNSIELLCYVNSITDSQNSYYGHTTSGSGYFWISCLRGVWGFYTHTDSASKARHYYSHNNGKAAAIVGGWNHIVIVFEPSSTDKTLTFYVNGVEITEATHYSGQTTTYNNNSGGTNSSEGTYTLNSSTRGGYYMIGSHNYNADVGSTGAVPDGIVAHVRYWSGTGLTASDVHNLNKYKHYLTFSSSGYAISTLPSFNTAGYSVSSVPAVSSDIYIHGPEFLYNLNRKYYVNQLRMIVDKAPHRLPTSNAPTHFWNFRVDQTVNSGDSIQDSISGVNGTFNTTKTLTSSLGYSNTSDSTSAVSIDSMEIQGTFSFEFYGQLTSINTVGACPFFNLRKSDGAGGYNDTARRAEFKTASNGKILFYTDLTTNGVIYSSNAFTDFNTDVHLIIVFNNDDLTAKVYQNGSLLMEDTMTGPRVTDTFDNFELFNTYAYSRGLFCHAYQVRMWNGTALTATEVSSIYKTLTGSENYGEYSISNLAYSGSSFSGKKMESNNPNLYLNTAYDISYGFTEDHTTSVYDLSYNKNQFSILDVSGGGVVQVNPIIKLEDSSLNTEKITSGAKIGVHYDNKLQTPVKNNYDPSPTHFWNFRVDQIINSGSSIQDSISGVNGTFNTTKTLTSSLGYTNTNSSTEKVTIDSITVQGTFSVEYYGQFPGINTVGTCAWLFLARSDSNHTNRLVQLKSTSAGRLTLEGSNLTAAQTASSAFSTGVNIHLVGVFNNDDLTAKLYQNGSLLLETTMTTARETDTFDSLTLLNTSGGTRAMYVNAYQVRMWNGTALTENQVKSIYNSLENLETISFFNSDFYTHLGIRDSTTLFNNRISNDGKTIVALNNRGTEAYDASNAEVVFSTDYGKNWKNVLQDCSDTFLFNENDISYNLLFATGDASGAIDIATSGNGRTMYVGRQSNVFTIENNYSGYGKTDPPTIDIDTTRSTGFPQSMFTGSYIWGTPSSDWQYTTSQTATLSSSNNQLGITEAEGSYTVSCGGGWTFYRAYDGYPPQRQFHNAAQYNTSIKGDMRGSNSGGWNPSGSITAVDANGNSNTYTVSWIKFDFPSTITVKPTTFTIHMDYNATHQKYIFGEDVNGVTRLIASNSQTISTSGRTINLSNIGDGLKSLTYSIAASGNYYRILNAYFRGTIAYGSGNPGIPIPTSGLPEIYTTNYGNSWKLSPFKFHSGPTIISGDGSTILLLQQQKLNNDRHGYVSSLGNETSSIDCHWLTTDYGATWRTLNRSGHDASNNIIPPSYGSKTATFFKACMSYSGQYIYIYNVQCTTNSNYGELYYSHDYGVTFNKWVTSEAQTVITGTGQISCSGSGKYVYIAGTNSSSAFVYYRSTDYGLTFNKDITKFPWQSYTLSESSTSAGPFISYEGDLIVTAGNNTSVTTGNSDLQYSLDYGVNYNDLSLNSDTISNITNSFINLPNKTNTLFTTTDVSTKTGIFANSPGPNEYKFLTNILGQTDISNIYLQTIEFPKENPTKTIENEGPVFFTSEEPVDKENDFGQNISNTSAGSNKLWNIAVSEDGQKLLAGGAVDISNGAFYAGYNLTNAKFPPTEKVVTDIVPTPAYYWELRRSSGDVAKVDVIQSKEFDTFNNITVSTTTGAVVDSTSDGMGGSNLSLTPDYTVEFYWTVASADVDSYATMFHLVDPNGVQNGYGGMWLRRRGNDVWTVNNGYTSASTNVISGNSDTAKDCALGTTNHVVVSVSTTNGTIKGYINNVLVVDTTFSTPMENHVWEKFSFGSAMSSGVPSRYDCAGDYYYLRIYHTALNTTQINSVYNGRTIIDYNNWTSSTNLANIPHFKTANLSYDGNQALLVPYGITQTNAQNLYYWTASGDFHRFEENHLSNFDAENWKFGKLSGDGNFFVGFTHSSTALSDTNYNSDTWWTDPVSNTMIIYKTMQKISKGTVADATATTEAGGTTYDLNNAFSSDSGVTSYHITHVNVSETGQYILIVGGNSSSTYTNRCAFSSDFGVTFSDISSKFSFTDVTKALVYCHVSDNGRYLFISQYNSNEYCFSSDYGNTFTLRNTFPSSTKTYGVVSRDGQNALFVDTNKYVYTSVNGNFRQEVIPALSGVNSGLSLTHNNWKYSSTLSNDLIYNPSMPNIKYFLGLGGTLNIASITVPIYNFDFRQYSSTTITDSIGGLTATYNNLTSDVINGAQCLSANSSYIDLGTLNIPATLSIEIYFQTQTQSSYGQIYFGYAPTTFSYGDSGVYPASTAGTTVDETLEFYSSSTDNRLHWRNYVNGVNKSGYRVDNQGTGQVHMVATYENGSHKVYLNGNLANQLTIDTHIAQDYRFLLNKSLDGDSFTDRDIYYFRVYDYILSAAQVSELNTEKDNTAYISLTNNLTSSTVRYTGSYFSELDIKGSLTNLSGTGYTSSDYRVKKNVTSLDEADTIASLVPVSYTQNNLHHKKAIGFIAHEFAQSFPDLVIGEKDGPEMQSINYNGIIAVLIKEVQTLRAKINELKSQI